MQMCTWAPIQKQSPVSGTCHPRIGFVLSDAITVHHLFCRRVTHPTPRAHPCFGRCCVFLAFSRSHHLFEICCAFQAIVRSTPTQFYSPRYHKLAFEPWPGGPTDVEVTLTIPRKFITVWNPTFETVANVPPAEVGALDVAPPSPPPPPPPRSPPPSPAAAAAAAKLGYSVGTTVMVRTVDTDPGRSLKFARGETVEAGFHQLLGREVRQEATTVLH